MRRSINYLEKIGERIKFRRDEYITSTHEREYLYMLSSGSVKVERIIFGKPDPVFLFRLISGAPRFRRYAINPTSYYILRSVGEGVIAVNYIAETDCLVHRISNQFLRSRIHPDYRDSFHFWLGRQILQQNKNLLLRIDESSISIEKAVLKKIRSIRQHSNGMSTIRINRAQIGRELGLSRRTISRVVSKLDQAGKITRLEGNMVIVHPWLA